MFSTTLGRLPRPAGLPRDAPDDDVLRAVLAAQEAAGLDLLSAEGFSGHGMSGWLRAAALTDKPVRQTLRGPYTLGREGTGSGPAAMDRDRSTLTLAMAESLHAEVAALAEAGCPFVEIAEPDAVRIGDDATERALFREAHLRLADGIATHLSLSIVGGNADTAGAATVFDPPYASYGLDLIAGPDNWRLAAQAPADRGIVCGALSPGRDGDEGPELLVWAVHYAASTGGRGLDRVGLANAPGLDALSWDVAIRKLEAVANGARIATQSPDDLARLLDPRAVSSKSAAFGRYVPPARRTHPKRR